MYRALPLLSLDGRSFEPLRTSCTRLALNKILVPCEAPWSLDLHRVGVVSLTQLFRLAFVRVHGEPSRLRRSSNWLRLIESPSPSLSQPWLASCTPMTSGF